MSINDFYAMFVSSEESALFTALRKLSLIDDPHSAMNEDSDDSMDVWVQWVAASPVESAAFAG